MTVTLVSISRPAIGELKTAEDLIAYTARVSNPTNQMNMETAPKLLGYLIRNSHWSPFEMVSMTVEIVTTRDIARQILRHRSFSFQEFSQRYAAVTANPVFSEARLQDVKNRQNSLDTDDAELQAWWLQAQESVSKVTGGLYKQALDRGLAKEQSRKLLPEGLTESRLYMAGTVRSFIHYCDLRTMDGTQKEHRDIAFQVRDILAGQFPSLSEHV